MDTLSNVHISGQQNVTGATVFRSTKRLRIGDPLPDTRFVDQDGRPFRFAQLKDQYVVMAFIYTRCKDARMCPLITSKFAQLQKRLPANVRLVEVTLDPDFDKPAVLRKYAEPFRCRFQPLHCAGRRYQHRALFCSRVRSERVRRSGLRHHSQ